MAGTATSIPSGGSGVRSETEAGAGPKAAHSPWTELEDHLERARSAILAEIRNYPPPIAACDQQFNYLLEQRDRTADALSRLASVRCDSAAPTEADVKALVDFITASEGIAHERRAQLVQLLNQRLGKAPGVRERSVSQHQK
jgi:hypothetical protein